MASWWTGPCRRGWPSHRVPGRFSFGKCWHVSAGAVKGAWRGRQAVTCAPGHFAIAWVEVFLE